MRKTIALLVLSAFMFSLTAFPVEAAKKRSSTYRSSTKSSSSTSSSRSSNTASKGAAAVAAASAIGLATAAEVKTVQTKLTELGYDCGPADGIPGEKTIAAVKQFQEDQGLEADGLVGSATKTALGM